MSNNHTSSIRTLRGRAKSTKKRGGFRSGIAAPMSAGACSPKKNVLRYLPLRCHLLHFEITVNGKTALKIIAGSWLEAKREKDKVAEKPQENGKEAC